MQFVKRFVVLSMMLCGIVILTSTPAQAESYTLTNNSGTANAVFFIIDEPSLVMNGFDLQPRGISRPVQLDRVSIDVVTPIPDVPIEVVVYQDPDGGDPINSSLVGRQTVNINQAGLFTAVFDPPLQITDPVVWVGFYLPPGFEFNADRSGTSVLTYWGWTPNSTFDLNNLRSAQVFGPGDGSAPVNIDMNGVARITAGLITDGTVVSPTAAPDQTVTTRGGRVDTIARDSQGRIIQVQGDSNTSLAPMRAYSNTWGCGALYYDTANIRVNYRNSVAVGCKTNDASYSPASPEGYTRRGNVTYDVTVFGLNSPGTVRMTYPITHCLRVTGADQNRAVLGLAYGAPHEWEILPTVRFGELICAELYYAGPVAYFVPN
ncbi:MAG: hypothetical protein EA396_13655 [Anaerolineaceae bacterium]|nr:MAG: hypothetical protein EA396_13655 [Anaerolineaceae bacterium]